MILEQQNETHLVVSESSSVTEHKPILIKRTINAIFLSI